MHPFRADPLAPTLETWEAAFHRRMASVAARFRAVYGKRTSMRRDAVVVVGIALTVVSALVLARSLRHAFLPVYPGGPFHTDAQERDLLAVIAVVTFGGLRLLDDGALREEDGPTGFVLTAVLTEIVTVVFGMLLLR